MSEGGWEFKKRTTLIVLTRLAVLLATSLADCTNWRLAVGLAVRAEARRQLLHNAEVCLATMVAAESTCGDKTRGRATLRAGRKCTHLGGSLLRAGGGRARPLEV